MFLLGKPLSWLFEAKQDFVSDTFVIGPEAIVIHNEIMQPKLGNGLIGVNLTLDVNQVQGGGSGSRSRLDGEPTVPTVKKQEPQSVLTRETDPWKPEHVERILREVTLRWDITETEHDTAQTTIAEFADCFALFIKEVNTILGAVHTVAQKNAPMFAYFVKTYILLNANIIKKSD